MSDYTSNGERGEGIIPPPPDTGEPEERPHGDAPALEEGTEQESRIVRPAPPPPAAPKPTPVATSKRKSTHTGLKIALAIIVVVAVLAVAAVATLNVEETAASTSVSYPYTVTYDVLFPNSEVVRLGNVEILAIPQADKVTLSVNKQPIELAIGEKQEISAKHAVIRTLGVQVVAFDFKIDGTYRGMVGDRADFYLAFQTSRQVPSFLIDQLLPRNVEARPV